MRLTLLLFWGRGGGLTADGMSSLVFPLNLEMVYVRSPRRHPHLSSYPDTELLSAEPSEEAKAAAHAATLKALEKRQSHSNTPPGTPSRLRKVLPEAGPVVLDSAGAASDKG